MKKNIALSIEQARELLANPEKAKDLIKANFTEDELNPKPKMGWYVSSLSNVVSGIMDGASSRINVFPYKSQAEGVLAMSQLAQKMAEVNGSWNADWYDGSTKYYIEFQLGLPAKIDYRFTDQFLAFPTEEIRDKFFKDNIELIKEYGKIFLCE